MYAVSGASADWAKSINIKYTYSIELRGEQSRRITRFELPARYIVVTAEEAKAATFVFANRIVNNKHEL